MQRAHTLPFSKDIVFVDSTSSCDALNHCLTFVLTPCQIGAVPLAVIITSGQSASDYKAGFQLLKDAMPNSFCGQGFPNIFITDDSDSERCALKSLWPNSKTLLCRFHVSQSVWRWLWEKKHNIPANRRKDLYQNFQNILVASTEDIAVKEYSLAIQNCSSLPAWQQYLTDYWNRREDWCLAYRDSTTHGHQTNNFSEISVRLFKDIVLSRNKAYNAVALVDFCCTAMEEYYLRRLRNFIHQRDVTCRLLLKRYLEKIKYLQKQDIRQLSNDLFSVPSEKAEQTYDVDISNGFCSCSVGRLGSFCKHQAGVLHYFQRASLNAPSCSTESRYLMAQLAFGENVQPKEFYMPFTNEKLNETITEVPECSDINLLPKNDTTNCQDFTENQSGGNISDVSFESLINLMKEKNTKFGTTTQSFNRFVTRLNLVKTRNAWESFLNTAGSTNPLKFKRKSVIHVQPTSIARRRPGVVRGCKRAPIGRPAECEPLKKRPKRRHNLAENVKANRPNAIKHGAAH